MNVLNESVENKVSQYTKINKNDFDKYEWAVQYAYDIITTLTEEFKPYAGQILLNNLPSIDGVLPVHRKVIWALYKNKITHDKPYIKMLRASAYSMVYYIFGDMPLTKSMKNMANNGINYFYLDPKGSFGDKQKRKGVGASPRYIECKLAEYSEDLLKNIEKHNVQMKKNFDNTEYEPTILPSMIPNILSNTSQSIAVGEASKIPAHNMADLCDSIKNYIIDKDIDKAIDILKCPDMSLKGQIVYDKKVFNDIYKTGKGSFTLLGKYRYDEKDNKIIIYEIPYESYIEDIEDKLRLCVDKGLFKEVADTHDNSGKQGIELFIYLKKNTNVPQFISKLRKYTPFESKFACNFTILDLDGKTPKLMSLQNIYDRWIQHRINCIKSEYEFDIDKFNTDLHLLYGLKTIVDDIALDNAIKLIRSSKTESEATQKLIKEFKLTDAQAKYISTIRLMTINKEWIHKKIDNIDELENKINDYKNIINDENIIKNIICEQLEYIKKKYNNPRLTEIIYDLKTEEITKEDLIEDKNVTIILTRQGYLKKLIKNMDSQKLKEDDEIIDAISTTNHSELSLITDKNNMYRLKVWELEEHKPSQLGTYLKNEIKDIEADENIIKGISIQIKNKNKGNVLVCFKNGNVAKIKVDKFKITKNNNNVLNTESPILKIMQITNDIDLTFLTSEGKLLIINTSTINSVGSKNGKGVRCIKLGDNELVSIMDGITNESIIKVQTEKKDCVELKLNDNNKGDISYYYSEKRDKQGNFLYNCRQKKDRIIKVLG